MNTPATIERMYWFPKKAIAQPQRKDVGGWLKVFSILSSLVSIIFFNSFFLTSVEASPKQVDVLEIPVLTGSTKKTFTFPLYEQEGIHFFSAGLGKEERSLTYPPFPLKLIFVQGERAFLARVSIKLANQDGSLHLNIPGKEVEGPWLFIKIPPGTYVVSGTDSQGATIEKTMTIQSDYSTVAHFRFP